MTPFADWPVRPRAKHGESLAGYVYRLHSDNGHNLSSPAYQLLKACYCGAEPSVGLDEMTIIKGLPAGGEDFDPVAWNLAWRSMWWSSGLHIAAGQPCRTGLKICPSCLREFRFHLRFWELPWVCACPLHRCKLLTRCSRCDEALNWYALRPDWKHHCGHSLLSESHYDATSFELGISTWLSRAIDAPPCDPALTSERLQSQTSMTLRMKYRQLTDLQEVRRLFVGTLLPILRGPACYEGGERVGRCGPKQWELKMALAGSTGLQHGLRRWARRYFRRLEDETVHQPLLLRLSGISAEARLLDELMTCGALREPLLSFLREYVLEMPFEDRVVLNPRIAEAHRFRQLRQFRLWWWALCLRVRSEQKTAADSDSMMWARDFYQREQSAFDTLNTVLRISAFGLDVAMSAAVFAPLVSARTWSSTDDAAGLLRRIAAQLLALPDQVLKRVASDSLALVAALEVH